ncbi:PREDICTED: ethylmalonyl-CoA decarboxylase-like [Miniopterus natalensis]|uniref:ethylmalonyl-CoA decarboxylase-like n=1 Tax=Miniopterus natalensis TaxID=291302 RepID=UPI0007A717EA|nr:PREDICTED: ethylmalonyl-CoA decarboxylase-like [Miniopterus natalensis]
MGQEEAEGVRDSQGPLELAASLLKTSSMSVRTKLLHRIHLMASMRKKKKKKTKLQQFPGGSVDLQEEDNGIGVLTLNSPRKRSAFSGVMMLRLLEKGIELENWTEGKGLIVRGAKNTFSSESDLNAVEALGTPEDGTSFNKCCSASRLGIGWRSRIYYSM